MRFPEGSSPTLSSPSLSHILIQLPRGLLSIWSLISQVCCPGDSSVALDTGAEISESSRQRRVPRTVAVKQGQEHWISAPFAPSAKWSFASTMRTGSAASLQAHFCGHFPGQCADQPSTAGEHGAGVPGASASALLRHQTSDRNKNPTRNCHTC